MGYEFSFIGVFDGVELTVKFSSPIEDLSTHLKDLEVLGFQFLSRANSTPVARVPQCPIHNQPLKESTRKPNTLFCTVKDEHGYCKYEEPKS